LHSGEARDGMSEVQTAADQHEPSYYEIALTNRQVLVAFVILLVCVLGAFFSGVWVGRGGARHEPPSSNSAQAAQAAQAVPGQPMQELQFFAGASGAAKPAAAPTPAQSPPPGPSAPANSLASDLTKKPEAPTAAVPEQHAAETLSQVPQPPPEAETGAPGAVTPPVTSAHATPPGTTSAAAPAPATATPPGAAAPTPTKPKPAAVASAPAAVPAAGAASAAAPATSPATAAAKPELAPGEMVVQVLSTTDSEQAKKTLAKVNKGGYKAYLSPLVVGKQTMYRVRIGPFTDHAQAQKIADQVRKKFRLDTWITR
jgi:DedD protein